MAIFNSYVSLPEGKPCNNLQQVGVMGYIPDMFWHVLAMKGTSPAKVWDKTNAFSPM